MRILTTHFLSSSSGLVFNKNFELIVSKSGYQRMSTAAREDGLLAPQGVAHQLLQSYDIPITEPGYVYIYLSNEEPGKEVYFDDFTVEHEKSPIVQSDEYYPFGLTFNSYQRENSLYNKYQYNGKEIQNDLGLGWSDYGARMYMSDIGRWGVADPSVEKYESASPYAYTFNNPVRFIDVRGKDPGDVVIGFTGGVYQSSNPGNSSIHQMVQSVHDKYLKTTGGNYLVVNSRLYDIEYQGVSSDGFGIPIYAASYNFPPTEERLDKLTDSAFDYVTEHYNKDSEGNSVEGGRVTILGFSYGGVLAMHLARRLEKAGIPIELLGTLDPAAGGKSGSLDRTVPENVKKNRNYYQTSDDNTVGSYGAPNRRKNGTTRNIHNIKVTVNHEKVDDEYGQALVNWVLNQLKR